MGKFIDGESTAYPGMGIGARTSCDPDNITLALPNATSVETEVIRLGKVQARIEAEVTAVEELTIADGATFEVELFWDSERDGSFTESRVVNAYAPSGATEVIPAGGTIGLIIPETDVEQFCKFKFTASGDLSSNNVAVKLYEVA